MKDVAIVFFFKFLSKRKVNNNYDVDKISEQLILYDKKETFFLLSQQT